jgi:hypothetical protein
MADFRRFLPALALFALIVISSVPAAAQLQCLANAAVPTTVRQEGIAELVGDVLLNCNTGTAGPSAGLTANIQIFLNTNVTSRITSGKNLEALMIFGENTGTPSYYQGTQGTGTNSIVWNNVPVIASGTTTSVLRFTNIRANATSITSSSLIPGQIVALISISSSTSVPVNNPQQIVGIVQTGWGSDTGITGASYKQCISAVDSETGQPSPLPTFTFAEGFGGAFRPAYNVATRTGSLSQPAPSVAGAVYGDESGFIPSSLATGGSVAGIGSASQGTQLQITFNNIPSGVVVNVPTILVGSNETSYAWLVNNSAADPGVATASTWYPLTATGGTAVATYEVGASDPNTVEEFTGNYFLTFTSNPGAGVPAVSPTIGATITFAPAYPTSNGSAYLASSTLPVPRFNTNGVTASNLITITACVTNLLYPYVTTYTGFDTGIAIANTGVDVSGLTTTSAGQSGTCSLYMFGHTGGNGGALVQKTAATGTISAGDVYAWSVYNGDGTAGNPGVTNFTGYLIARCNFQYAHGYAFVSNLGLTSPGTFAQSYVALVIPDRGGERPVDSFLTAGSGSGEILGQ